MPVANPKLALQTVVTGPSGILAIADICKITVRILSGETGCAGSRAGSKAGRNKGTKSVGNQACQGRVRIHGLEIANNPIAYVACFEDHLAGNFVLNTEDPFLSVRLMEIRSDGGVVAEARITSARNIPEVSSTY